ncbi:ZCHC7 protein, partial [Calcarius ornatus]|nr:ZCHC7 protein [Calcarius ornatus]
REAQRVYVRRDEEKQRTDARILVAAVKEMQAALNTKKTPGRNKQQMSGSIFKNTGPVCFSCHEKGHLRNSCPILKGAGPTCFYCHKKGHLQKNCRKKQQDEKIFQQ